IEPPPPLSPKSLQCLGRYSALFLGVACGAKRYNYLKPRAEEERRIAAGRKRNMQHEIDQKLKITLGVPTVAQRVKNLT
uniref:ATP synthase F(0) complex subunit e, mitochondrial n=1 Tax=Sus scrofa TaxID=9823 RepID=A0A287A2B0_PIG